MSKFIRTKKRRAKERRLQGELDYANMRIEELEWENKGIEEWRDFALAAHNIAKEQRERAERAEAELDALREPAENYKWLRDVHTHYICVARYIDHPAVPKYEGVELDNLLNRVKTLTNKDHSNQ